jgi:hypothetical protein
MLDSRTTNRFVPLAAVILAACQTPTPDYSEGRSITNSTTRTVIAPEVLKKLRETWQTPDPGLLAQSKVGRDVQWSFDYIATIESGGPTPCSKLALRDIRQQEVKPFRVQDREGKPISFTPKSFYESWFVEACGRTREWRLLDEATDSRNPLRILLWRAA